MQMDFISRVGHVVVTLSIFKTGHLNPTPTVSMTDTNEAVLTSGCWQLRTLTHGQTRTLVHTQKKKNQRHPRILFAYLNTHNAHATQHDNGYDICIYVKLASPFSAGQDPIIPARWAGRQPVSHSAQQQRWQKRIPDPGAFTRPSIHLSPPSSGCGPLHIPSLLHIQQQRCACMHAYKPRFYGAIEWPWRMAAPYLNPPPPPHSPLSPFSAGP